MKLMAFAAVALLALPIASCRKVLLPEQEIVPVQPDDPGIYEEGLYVTVNGAGMFTGEDWPNAMSINDLRDLLLTAGDGTYSADQRTRLNGKIIHLEQGIYPLAYKKDDGTLVDNPQMNAGTTPLTLTIKGGYKNGNYTQYPDKYHTYFSGGSDYHIVKISGSMTLTLDGVGFTGGTGEGGGKAAVQITGATVTLKNAEVSNNFSPATAGAFQISGGSVFTAENCNFHNNVAANAGVLNVAENETICTLKECVFSNNAANSQGGAIKVSSGTLKAMACRFENNHAEKRGGVIWVAGSKNKDTETVVMEDCIFTGNSCVNGGGVSWQDCTAMSDVTRGSVLTVRRCTVENNYASNGSAGSFYVQEGAANLLTLETCAFSNNVGIGYAGGSLHVRGNGSGASTLHCKNCSFKGESTTDRGGLIALGGSGAVASFQDCVIENCHGDRNSGVFYHYSTGGKLYFNACTFNGNNISNTYGTEAAMSTADIYIGMNNCAIAHSHTLKEGANSQQSAWYSIGKVAKFTISNCSFVGAPTAAGHESYTYGLIRLNDNGANVRFINNIIAATANPGFGIYGGDTQTALTVSGSYNKMSPMNNQKPGTVTYTQGSGDDLNVYASSFPGLEWDGRCWAWNGGYSGSAPLAQTSVVNAAIQTFDANFYNWLQSIGALGKDMRGNDRGATSWPGSYQN